MHSIRINDVGVSIIVTIQDSDGAATDVSDATDITFHFVKPSGDPADKTGVFNTDGTDGKVKYVTQSGDIDQEGIWGLEVVVEVGAQQFTSDATTFLVEDLQNWEVEFTELLRVMIGDLADPPTYTDERLRRVTISAAHIVSKEINFDNEYTVDISKQLISPDPDGDQDFANLTCAKAACLIERGETKSALQQGFMAKDGMGMTIDLRGRGQGYIDLAKYKKDWCSMYEQMKNDFLINEASELGEAVMGPIRVYADSSYRYGRNRCLIM